MVQPCGEEEYEDWVQRTTRLEIEGSRPAGRPKKTWNETVKADLRRLRLEATEKLGDEPYTLRGVTQAHLENGLENNEEEDCHHLNKI